MKTTKEELNALIDYHQRKLTKYARRINEIIDDTRYDKDLLDEQVNRLNKKIKKHKNRIGELKKIISEL